MQIIGLTSRGYAWICLTSILIVLSRAQDEWSWKCKDSRCIRELVPTSTTEEGFSRNVCKLLCGPYSILWPKPTGHIKISSRLAFIDFNAIDFMPNLVFEAMATQLKDMLFELGAIFSENVLSNLKYEAVKDFERQRLVVLIEIGNHDEITFTQFVDESYVLTVSPSDDSIVALIKAQTYLGARHGVETLTQLIVYDDVSGGLVIPHKVHISDMPSFTYRGLLLDTSRNFFSVEAIERTLDGMAASKLNTFHWHITDSQSFPMEVQSYPELSRLGAYGPNKVYSQNDIRRIVRYAQVRGIRVIPELDTPGHVGEGWNALASKGEFQDILLCFMAVDWRKYCAGPPCGQLNPVSEKVYDVLSNIYSEMASVFNSDLFHMGGDEVNLHCWNSTQQITEWMDGNDVSRSTDGFHKLWSVFQDRALEELEKVNDKLQKVIVWTSSLTEEGRMQQYLDNAKYIIQLWTTAQDKVFPQIIDNEYQVIISNYDALYLDCGFGPWTGRAKNNWCSPFISWQRIYNNDPFKFLTDMNVNASTIEKARVLVLGQEAAMWSEQVDEQNLDTRVWPRAAAMAERVWSNPREDWKFAEQRFLYHRERLVSRGIKADALIPEWCYQNEGSCP